ncbi:RHS repeat-associated core domain-containing protein, partial [Hymenobacter rubripertinctus]
KAYYSHRTWPELSAAGGAELLSVAYYDGYDFDQDGTADAAYQPPTAAELACQPGQVPAVDLRVTGQATRTLTRVLGRAAGAADAWLVSTSFFDERLRPIQVQSTNALGGTDVATTRYDFAGQALASYANHQAPGQPARAVREQRAYDAGGRLLTVTQELAGAPAQVLARHVYNELGQLASKQLGGQLSAANGGGAVAVPLPGGSTGPRALQTVDFRYNIRGWLTNINDIDNPAPADGDLWSFALSYACGFEENQYNGNIAGQRWRSASDGVERAYGYRYDKLNRLLQGDFVARSAGPNGAWGAERGNYRFSSASYDAGGNLLTLRRRGLVAAATRTSAAQYAETDNLRYRYQPAGGSAEPSSNRLLRVDDLAPAATAFGARLPARPDFTDGSTTGSQQPDYTYDAAGSLTSDQNKGITQISYNYLHLPERLEWANGNVLEYTYSAAGQKVSKRATEAGKAAVRTDYVGPWQYERDSLRWLSHAEGRALYVYKRDPAGQVSTKVQYEYTLKDHLGNLRVAFHPGERKVYHAYLEPNADELRREQSEFDSVSVSAPIRRVDPYHQLARSGVGFALLNAGGTQPQPLGPLKQLTVAKGDTVDVVAYGMYQQPARANWSFSLASFVASLLQPAVGPAPPDGGRKVRVLPLLSVGLGLVPAVQQLAGGVPKAYVRVLVYNADSALVDWRTQQLTSAANASVANGGYERLSLRVFVPAAGYVQAYVANESDTDVFFDDISVEHRQGLQVQENQYDPFGLDLAGLSKSATPANKYSWNGKERQDEFGLNWHDYGFRNYDPQLGRFMVVDPWTESYSSNSPYTYAFNNPVRYTDFMGLGPEDEVKNITVTSTNSTDKITEKSVNVTKSKREIKSNSKEFNMLLGKSAITSSNGIGDKMIETITATTTTTTSTFIEYDDKGGVIGEPVSTINTETVTKTNVTIEGKLGGSVGGFTTSDRTTSVDTHGLSKFSKEAIAYRGNDGKGLSITTRDENGPAKARADEFLRVLGWGVGTGSSALIPLLQRFGFAAAGRLATPLAIVVPMLTLSAERGKENLPKSNEPCNGCTKTYSR